MANPRRSRAGFASIVGLSEICCVSIVLAMIFFVLMSIDSWFTKGNNDLGGKPVVRIAFAGNPDSVWIQQGTSVLHILDLKTADVDPQFDLGNKAVTDFAVSADANAILIEVDSNQVICLRSGQPIVQQEFPANKSLLSALSANGNTLCIVLNRTAVQLWDVSKDPPSSVEYTLGADAHRILLNSDGKTLIVSTVHSGLVIFNASNGEQQEVLDHRMSMARSLSFSQDDQSLLAASDRELRLYDLVNHQDSLMLEAGHNDEFLTAKISPDGTWAAVSGEISGVQLVSHKWDNAVRRFPINTISHRFAFDPSSSTIFTGDSKGMIRTWLLSETGDFPRKGSEFVFAGGRRNNNANINSLPATRI